MTTPTTDTTATKAQDGYQVLPTAQLVASLTNPRKHFDQGKLTELASNIGAMGLIQPIIVRPLPGARLQETFLTTPKGSGRPTHEIVAGERRWRASTMVGLESIPCLIRHLTDDQVLEIQVVENLQRDDLTALEEAEGYQLLMDHNHLSADEVAIKVGKSRSYIYARLRLLDLSPDCAQALREGRIDNSRALVIARVPDSQLQIKALDYATTASGITNELPGLRMFTTWVQNNLMIDLAKASFDPQNLEIIPAAGSCYQCPKRTGAAPDLFADIKSPDLCIDKTCFEAKAAAWHDILFAQAEAKGLNLITGWEAKRALEQDKSGTAQYTDIRELVTLPNGDRVTVKQALDVNLPSAALIEDPKTHKTIEAVPTVELTALLLKKGIRSDAMPTPEKADPKRLKIEIGHIKTKAERRLKQVVQEAKMNVGFEDIDAIDSMNLVHVTTRPQYQKALAAHLLDLLWGRNALIAIGAIKANDDPSAIPYKDMGEQVKSFLETATEDDLLRSIMRTLVFLSDDEDENFPAPFIPAYIESLQFDGSNALESKMATRVQQATDKLRDETEAEIAAVTQLLAPPKAAPAKSLAAQEHLDPPAPLAQAKKPTPASAGKKRAIPKPKTTAEEAITGIAAAMQQVEASPDLRTVDESAWPFPGERSTTAA